MRDVLVALLDHGADPHAHVRGHDVGQPESGQKLPPVDIESGVHEDEVHLTEGEQRLQDGVDAAQHLEALRVPRDLEEVAQLHAVVDDGAEAEPDAGHPQEEAAVAEVVLGGLVFAGATQRGQLLPHRAAVG